MLQNYSTDLKKKSASGFFSQKYAQYDQCWANNETLEYEEVETGNLWV